MTRTVGLVSALALASVPAGCASPASAPVATPPAAALAASPPRVVLPPLPDIPLPADAPKPGEWTTWSRDQKMTYMKGSFMTAERAIFASWEPVRFKEITCHHCHGPGVIDGTFRLPNPDLPRLAPGADGFRELLAHEPEVLAFMQKRVVPETARLLGMAPFDMETHTGFSCYQCHVRQG